MDAYEPLDENTQRAYFAGQNHLIKGDLEAAYSSFQVCVEAEPEVASFHFDLGKIEHELGRHESALMHYDIAVGLDSENDWYYYHRGLTQLALENFGEAWIDLASWITQRPSDIESLDMCATMFILADELSLAYKLLSYYEDGIAYNSDVRQMRFSILHEVNPDSKQLNDFIDNAMEDFPEEAIFKYEKALLECMLGQFDTAILRLLEISKSHPDFTEVSITLAKCYYSINREDLALSYARKAFANDLVPAEDKLDFFNQNMESEDIFDLLKIAIEAHSDDSRFYYFLGIMKLEKGELVEAEHALRKVLEFDPNSLEPRLDYLKILYNLKEWDDIISTCEEALLIFPLEPIFYLYSGTSHKENKDYLSAIKSFKGGLGVVFDSPELAGQFSSELAMCYRETGELEKSYEAFEESLIYVEDPFIMNNHAYFLATDGQRIQDALEWSTKANIEKRNEPNFLDTQALILHLLDRNEEALELIQKAQILLGGDSSPDAVFLEREGDILFALGKIVEARAKWEKAIISGGGKKRLNEKLDKISNP
jgi:tetratricopeptide (TPR) repeat protein